MRTAILAGATGLVGGHLLRQILDRTGEDGAPAYHRVVVLTRRPLPEGGITDGGDGRVREVVVPDFARLDTAGDALVGDHVYCALGTTIKKAGSQKRFRTVDFDHPLTLARLTWEAGARHFALVSSMGASPTARTFYLRVKGELEEAVREVGFSGVTVARPSVIGGARGEFRPAEWFGKFLLGLVPGRLRTVRARDIAKVLVTLTLQEGPGFHVVESEVIRRLAR